MQSKGFIKTLAILFGLASIWQLSFTFVSRYQRHKAEEYAIAQVAKIDSSDLAMIPEDGRSYYLDTVYRQKVKWYLDSISNQKVYFGYTYKEAQSKEIHFGLDLVGGMNDMLQLQFGDMLIVLSDNSQDEGFQKAIAEAKQISAQSSDNFIDIFAETWKQNATPGMSLAQIFAPIDRNKDEKDKKIKSTASDEEVLAVLREEAKVAVANSINVLDKRINRFGVTQPNIQRVGNNGRILVELPGVNDKERVRNLLKGTASLEFWTCMKSSAVFPSLQEINNLLAEDLMSQAEAKGDTIANVSVNPLFEKLHPNIVNGIPSDGACVGFVNYTDTAAINKILADPMYKGLLPQEFRPMWTAKPSELANDANVFELVAIYDSEGGKASLGGSCVIDARVQYGSQGQSRPEVSMTMDGSGATEWAHLTKQAVDAGGDKNDMKSSQIAIVLDGFVYSYPNVNSEITGGSSQITGNFTLEEAEDLANVLKSGKLPAPASIVQESVVGSSLGEESIRSGALSFIIAFLLVLIYMILFYKGAGWVANVALLCNVLFLFGTLASFGAVLTLPGIAGLVLTLGMAVDANVIIYERIKEEINAGKGLSKAIDDGFHNAYSAIVDGQITTLLTGIVLFVCGSGPVKGFATTLIIGIITSVLTSIFIPRLIFSGRVSRGKNITFENKVTKNFLKNTHIDFLGKRKFAYIFSGILIIASIVSIRTKGFTLGVDFTGGRTYVVSFDNPISVNEVRSAIVSTFTEAAEKEGIQAGSIEVKQFGEDNQIKITTSFKKKDNSNETSAAIENMLYSTLKDFYKEDITLAQFRDPNKGSQAEGKNVSGIVSSDSVGPSIADDLKKDAIWAVIVALIIIFAYIAIRFRKWTWGLGGVVSLAHTALIVIGFFSIFSGILPFSLDVDMTFIAAILTIIGYAINDNVVIFDRIREYKKDHPKAELSQNVNLALNATLSRTINTSLTTLVTMLAIAIFGGEVIRGLAVALILGIVIGTYASIFIGTTVMYDVTMAVAKRKANKKK